MWQGGALGRLLGVTPHGPRAVLLPEAPPDREDATQAGIVPSEPAGSDQPPASDELENRVARKLDILRQEWDHCQSGIRGLDGVTMRIRNWAVTLFGGAIVFSLQGPSGLILLSAIPLLVIFYIIDVMFKRFQSHFVHRTETISEILREVNKAPSFAEQNVILNKHDFPCYDQYFRGKLEGYTLFTVVKQAHTWWLYVLTIGLAIGGYHYGRKMEIYPPLFALETTDAPAPTAQDTPANATTGSGVSLTPEAQVSPDS